jgi:putative endonuclease
MSSSVDAGLAAESRAAAHLERAGYRIVERNYRCRAGELDIIARDGDVLVFVEVRSRRSARFGHAVTAISPAKQRQVSRVAAHYVAFKRPRAARYRFDVVAITGDELLVIRDAWRR